MDSLRRPIFLLSLLATVFLGVAFTTYCYTLFLYMHDSFELITSFLWHNLHLHTPNRHHEPTNQPLINKLSGFGKKSVTTLLLDYSSNWKGGENEDTFSCFLFYFDEERKTTTTTTPTPL